MRLNSQVVSTARLLFITKVIPGTGGLYSQVVFKAGFTLHHSPYFIVTRCTRTAIYIYVQTIDNML